MRRREFILALGGAAATWPLAVRAQQPRKPTIGFFIPTTRAPSSVWVAAFVQRLRELGWSEGGTITIEYRWADGREERFAAILDEFVRMKVDLINTFGTAPVLAAKRATAEIPIVFALAADPVGTGLVTSLARPGGNVTGMSTQHNDLVGKRIELLREVVPELRKLAIMGDVSTAELQDVEAAARAAGLDAVRLELRRAEDIAPSFGVAKEQAQALYVVTTPLTQTARVQIAGLVLETRLPSVHGTQNYVEFGRVDVLWPQLLRSVPARRRTR